MFKIELTSDGEIDNAVIYLEDPKEKIPYFLQPSDGSGKSWELDNLKIPLQGELDYGLYVVAFSGTKFNCVITNKANDKTIEFSGTTGSRIKGQAYETGSSPI